MSSTECRPRVAVRAAGPADAPTLLALITGLAAYEGLPPPDAGALARRASDAAAEPPRFWALLAEREGRAVGFAFYFFTYSTILARPTLFLEDLFVLPAERRGGVARALFRALARVAVAEGCGRLDWQVLTWNQLAMDFYERLGAAPLPEWQPWRLLPEQFARLAAEEE
ncbi:MAG: GNAT family N-acetyltransferase [Chloroflexota bacterium]